MEDYKIILNEKDLELLSAICHEYKDIYRGCGEVLLPVMDLEKKLTAQTVGAYESDTTYDWKNPDAHYSVWVGGGEVNDYLVTKEVAEEIAAAWRAKGYDDVYIDDNNEPF